ncbi:MAG: GTPase ObgE [Haliscomenobacteraceae bacterium CHB4]|nr:GTPase Obg [Saprospiraceae bacterium]MCE7922649.1 GTPase ObgE [Haliscomenobacteraceae bacterium CHB4]
MENFVDYVKIMFRSGKGGAGSVHFYRGPATPKGGPDGGDGGRGGHIILEANPQEWTLLDLKYKKHIYAEDGQGGRGGLKTGSDGADVVVKVPLGTVAKDAETGEFLLEITRPGQKEILLPGGRGGKGNNFFKTATHQTPRYAQPGEPGIEQWIVLELKVLADVGLVGFPNAGKSTLLSAVTAAKPKIGDYPFTTLVPNLGIVKVREGQTFIMADIPGIIEGAHEGRGLGHRFLRHIERNSVLLFLIPADTQRVIRDEYNILLNELTEYNPELLDKPRLLAISKSDLIDDDLEKMLRPTLPEGVPVIFISSMTNKNLQQLKDLLWKMLNEE